MTILKSGWLNEKRLLDFLIISTAAFLIGCGKKKETQPPTQTPSPAAPSQSAPAPAAPAPAPAASSADSYDAVVTAQSLAHLRSVVSRKDWPQAREALKQVQGRSLTPEQRGYVDSLKAQIPR